jgi:hypothetical protein
MCKLSRAYEERHIERKERKTKVEIVRWSDRDRQRWRYGDATKRDRQTRTLNIKDFSLLCFSQYRAAPNFLKMFCNYNNYIFDCLAFNEIN